MTGRSIRHRAVLEVVVTVGVTVAGCAGSMPPLDRAAAERILSD